MSRHSTADRVQLGLRLLQATATIRKDEVLVGASHDRIHAKLATTEMYDEVLQLAMEGVGWRKCEADDGYEISV